MTGPAVPSQADLAALEEYKRQAEVMTPAERAALLKKCSDTLPALSGSLAARIAMLNARDDRGRMAAAALDHLSKDIAKGMMAERAQVDPKFWHNRMQANGGGS